MLNIVSRVCPDDTYFTASEVRPYIENGELHITEGRGTRRSWGAPSVTSTVKELTPDVIKVDVVGWHKHTVSPVGGSYYFVNEKGEWIRRTANHKAVKAALSAAAVAA